MGHLINSFYNFPSHDTILNENVYTKYKYRDVLIETWKVTDVDK